MTSRASRLAIALGPSLQSLAASGGNYGSHLDISFQVEMGRRLGHDFSRVRVHSDAASDASARSLNALAFTIGSSIFFRTGYYTPETRHGRALLAHELVHVAQEGRGAGELSFAAIEDPSGPTEVEAMSLGAHTAARQTPKSPSEVLTGIARTPTSAAIVPLISYSAFDWEVTDAEERSVLAELRADPDPSTTVADLSSAGMLRALVDRVDEPANRAALMRLLGSRLNPTARALVEPHLARLDLRWQALFNLGRFGVTAPAPAFSTAGFAHLISPTPSDPFTGSGATGVSPTTLSIPGADQWKLARGDPATVARYSNPLGSLPAHLASLGPSNRVAQAELFLRRRISSVIESAYPGGLPSRARVIRAAALAHNLEPQLVAGFLLAEQRDQSRNEDAKDYLAATSIMSANTSIGLGQIVISTARRHDLFADLLSSASRSGLGHDDIARLLASDEFNTFAAARYLRKIADTGSTTPAASLPHTLATYPGLSLPAYATHSSTWPPDNIRALGSEYTSRAWDDVLRPAWGEFVYQAYLDVVAAGVL